MTRYVQHISGTGPKWQCVGDYEHSQKECWVVWNHDKTLRRSTFHLPCSEYQPCDPPKRWVDVTAKCEVANGGQFLAHTVGLIAHPVFGETGFIQPGYRLRKVLVVRPEHAAAAPGGFGGFSDAFIIESEEPA